MFGDCDKCVKPETPYSERRSAKATTLIGGFEVDLCSQCSNAWRDYALSQDAYKKFQENEIQVKKLKFEVDAGAWSDKAVSEFTAYFEKLLREQISLENDLYNLAKVWCSAP